MHPAHRIEPSSCSEEPEDGAPLVHARAMADVYERARYVARSPAPTLLIGETGTGKEVVARFIHAHGPRRAGPFVAVNCGAIPATLVETTLFGHEKGAFTGATARRSGAFESANGGTLLLDEIGELPLDAQACLLRVLDTGAFNRVGSSVDVRTDARVIGATHRNLAELVRQGRFREDLLYRLDVVTLQLPPLRARRADIMPLARYFVTKASGARVRNIDEEAEQRLLAYRWPGNVRELRGVMESAALFAETDTVRERDLPPRLRGPSSPSSEPESRRLDSSGLRAQVATFERRLILEALQQSGWVTEQAAQLLKLPARTLRWKMQQYAIKAPHQPRPPIAHGEVGHAV